MFQKHLALLYFHRQVRSQRNIQIYIGAAVDPERAVMYKYETA